MNWNKGIKILIHITTNVGDHPTPAQVTEVEQRYANLVTLLESAG